MGGVMDDKELLTLAAKAAGIELRIYDGMDVEPGTNLVVVDAKTGFKWNPLTDDGDALRLAVKLKIDISFEGFDEDSVLAAHTTEWKQEAYGDDPYAATRRAIVRAAAAIGQEMQ